jgi:hypothetical protein
VLRDRRGAAKAEIPDADEKGISLGSDPMAIYRPPGAQQISPAKAMDNFTGWSFAAVNAIAAHGSSPRPPRGPPQYQQAPRCSHCAARGAK